MQLKVILLFFYYFLFIFLFDNAFHMFLSIVNLALDLFCYEVAH